MDKQAAPARSALRFRVDYETFSNGQFQDRSRRFPTLDDAERFARKRVAETEISAKISDESGEYQLSGRMCGLVAWVHLDALGRVWTQAEAVPGEPALI